VLSVLRFMDSDYLFGIFKLFLTSPLFIEVPVPRGELAIMYMCAMCIDFASVSTFFQLSIVFRFNCYV